jgi:hypothetical protein
MIEGSFGWSRFVFALLSLVLAACEAGPSAKELGSETHFLRDCAAGCGDGFECLCGVCTQGCFEDASCKSLDPGASCVASAPRISDGTCADEGVRAFCDLTCASDADCASLEAPARCDAGYCRAGDPPGAPICKPTDMSGNALVIFGDALIELSPFTSSLEELARASGSLAAGANFRSYAAALNSFLAGDTLSLAVQYDLAREEGPFRVAVMNGGETDMLQGSCGDAPRSDCAAVQAAVDGLDALLARMAADGVTEVVYFFYADPVNRPMVKAGLDVLRPLAQAACETGPIPCHFVDLRPVFENRYTEYVSSDGLVFSEAGARASADTVWQRIQTECVRW